MSGLEGRVAIVTGGGSGLGAAIAKRLAGSGVKVLVSDINLKGAERAAQQIVGAGGTASGMQQDTARAEDSARVGDRGFARTGRWRAGWYGGTRRRVRGAPRLRCFSLRSGTLSSPWLAREYLGTRGVVLFATARPI